MYEIFCRLLSEKNLKPSDVSKATGIKESFFSNWKKKRHMINPEQAILIADYLGVSLDYLYRGKDSAKKSDSGKEFHFSNTTAEIAETIYNRKELNDLFSIVKNINATGIYFLTKSASSFVEKNVFEYTPDDKEDVSYPVLEGHKTPSTKYTDSSDMNEASELDDERKRIKRSGNTNKNRKAK